MYKQLEDKFNVIYPDSQNATYVSLLNYSDDLTKPLQRWFRYKEGFSINLVKQLISEYIYTSNGVILDPFLGSGSTIVAANQSGFKGIGFEVNPFSHFLARNKLRNYNKDVLHEFSSKAQELLSDLTLNLEYSFPKLSISDKVFSEEIEHYFMSLKQAILLEKYHNDEVKELLLLGWLACLEEVSNYRKAGNGLKKRKYVKPRKLDTVIVRDLLKTQYDTMLADIKNQSVIFNSKIINDTSLNMKKYIKPNTIDGIIFSPPYANCFDYTEIYKLELWFGDFVKEYSDLKKLRKQSLRSHLNSDLKSELDNKSTEFLLSLIEKLKKKDLWANKIPVMIESYFTDMFTIIDHSYNVLKKDGLCAIVVGNSSYGGIIIPTDLILAEYAESVGFTVDKIEVDRFIITSSQQYEITKENKKYLRESVICLKK